MALAKVLHFFCNVRFQDKLLVEIDTFLLKKVGELFSLYKSTTRDVIYLSRLHGGIGVKQFSTAYYCIWIAFITKMLNRNEEIFKEHCTLTSQASHEEKRYKHFKCSKQLSWL